MPTSPGASGSMSVVHGIEALDRSMGRLFMVVGVFDGLHLGHEYLLRELQTAAAAHAARPAVITFDHHPDEIITGHAPPLLCDPDERLERLDAAGVAVTVVQTFDVALRETPFDVFVRRIAGRVELAGFLMTPESAFGYERGGTPTTVAALGRELGYEVVVVAPFTVNGGPVSSSTIRGAIAAGDLATAQRLLGRPYAIVGALDDVAGVSRITFPMPVALPPAGSYRVRAKDLDATGELHSRELLIDTAGEVSMSEGLHGGLRIRIVFGGSAAG